MRIAKVALWGILMVALGIPARAGTPVLEDARELDGGGRFLVGPRWSPDGRLLLASGRFGRGLFTLPASGGAPTVIDPAFVGPAGWTPDGKVATDPPELDEAGRQWLVTGSTALVLEEYTGRLTVLKPQGARVLAEGAWDVRPSPDGRLIAYCIGHLAAPTLVVTDLHGATISRLAGAHPAWAPDGSGLVFARPEAAAGDAPFTASALVWWSAADGAQRELWSAGLAFQPAFSLDGAWLAWSDWATGRLLVARVRRGVRP